MTTDKADGLVPMVIGVGTGPTSWLGGPPSIPEWHRIIRIDGDWEHGFTTTVVQDYKLRNKLVPLVQQALLEAADSDDTDTEKQLLMTAWQAIAMYLSSCDDDDKPGALAALKTISNLMSDGPDDGPLPTGTFGTTSQHAASDWICPQCSRKFGTEAGLLNHLKTVHAAREKQPYATPANDKD